VCVCVCVYTNIDLFIYLFIHTGRQETGYDYVCILCMCAVE